MVFNWDLRNGQAACAGLDRDSATQIAFQFEQ
jgi:hypothetical protein